MSVLTFSGVNNCLYVTLEEKSQCYHGYFKLLKIHYSQFNGILTDKFVKIQYNEVNW